MVVNSETEEALFNFLMEKVGTLTKTNKALGMSSTAWAEILHTQATDSFPFPYIRVTIDETLRSYMGRMLGRSQAALSSNSTELPKEYVLSVLEFDSIESVPVRRETVELGGMYLTLLEQLIEHEITIATPRLVTEFIEARKMVEL